MWSPPFPSAPPAKSIAKDRNSPSPPSAAAWWVVLGYLPRAELFYTLLLQYLWGKEMCSGELSRDPILVRPHPNLAGGRG